MKKTFPLTAEGKNRDRILDAVKHEVRKYIKRERAKALPTGVDFWDFDCKFGAAADVAEVAHLSALTGLMDAVHQANGAQFYVEIVAKPGVRTARPAAEGDVAEPPAASE
jgi:Family of unknown function (DUF6172)